MYDSDEPDQRGKGEPVPPAEPEQPAPSEAADSSVGAEDEASGDQESVPAESQPDPDREPSTGTPADEDADRWGAGGSGSGGSGKRRGAPNRAERVPFRPSRGLVVALGVALMLALVVFAGQRFGEGLAAPLSLNDFRQLIDRNEVARIVFKENEARVMLRPGNLSGSGPSLERRVNFISHEHAKDEERRIRELIGREVDPLGVEVFAEHSNPLITQFLPSIVMMLIVIGVLYFLLFRGGRGGGGPGGVFNFGKSRARLASRETSGVTFADVAGVDEAKEEMTEIVEFLRNPEKFRKIGGRIPRGALLVGAPGTGKTLLAKAISGEAEVPFYSVSGSDFVEMFVGVGAARVRDLFKQARDNSPCIIFLDEIDAVGRRRGTGLGGGHDEREQTLNQILVEMDGFGSDDSIIILASTNRPDILDPALLRPGRFDRQVAIDLPDVEGREAILRVHAQKVKMATAIDLRVIARATPMFSGAELEALINEAAIIAAMAENESVAMGDLEEARDKVRWGRQRKSRKIDEEDRRSTAWHEAGHALISALLSECEPLHKVTIIPRGVALGSTMTLPVRDRLSLVKKRVLGQIAMCFGGRIGEQLVTGDLSTGASNDIEKATDLARRMVTEWGMSDALGPVTYSENEEHLFLGREVTRSRNHSDATAQLIDKEVRSILDSSYRRAEKLISKNRDKLDSIGEGLLVYETLTGAEVERLLNGVAVADLRGSNGQPSTPDAEPAEKDSSGGSSGWGIFGAGS